VSGSVFVPATISSIRSLNESSRPGFTASSITQETCSFIAPPIRRRQAASYLLLSARPRLRLARPWLAARTCLSVAPTTDSGPHERFGRWVRRRLLTPSTCHLTCHKRALPRLAGHLLMRKPPVS